MSQKPQHAEDGTECPKWQDLCSNRCHKCKFWRPYPVTDEKGARLPDHWDCSLAFAGQVAVQQVGETAQNTKAVQQLTSLVWQTSKIQTAAMLHDDPEALMQARTEFKLIEARELARSRPQIAN